MLALFAAPLVVSHTPLPPVAEIRDEIIQTSELAAEPEAQEKSTPTTESEPLPEKKASKPTSPKPPPTPAKTEPGDTALATLLEEKIWIFTNTERSLRGLPTLTTNATLAATARAHSADMLARDFFDHENPDGCGSSCRATNAGYSWRMIGGVVVQGRAIYATVLYGTQR